MTHWHYYCFMVCVCCVLCCAVLCAQVNTVVQTWTSEHFTDFEGIPEMENFLDWFEQELVKDVSPSVHGINL